MSSELFFPEGLVGCADWQRFTLEQSPEMAPLALLHSQDQPGLSLIVVDPWLIDPAYTPTLAEVDRVALAVNDDADLQWLSVLTVQNYPLVVTANLIGPLVINRAGGTARQVILSQSGYWAAQPVTGSS